MPSRWTGPVRTPTWRASGRRSAWAPRDGLTRVRTKSGQQRARSDAFKAAEREPEQTGRVVMDPKTGLLLDRLDAYLDDVDAESGESSIDRVLRRPWRTLDHLKSGDEDVRT